MRVIHDGVAAVEIDVDIGGVSAYIDDGLDDIAHGAGKADAGYEASGDTDNIYDMIFNKFSYLVSFYLICDGGGFYYVLLEIGAVVTQQAESAEGVDFETIEKVVAFSLAVDTVGDGDTEIFIMLVYSCSGLCGTVDGVGVKDCLLWSVKGVVFDNSYCGMMCGGYNFSIKLFNC